MQTAYRFTPRPDRLEDPTKAPLANPQFAGTVRVPPGSAAAPSLAFAGDPDTGTFRPAEDVVGIAVGGTERVRVASWSVSLGGAPGLESLRVVPIANAANWVQVAGSVTGNGFVTVAAQGGDSDVSLRLQGKGNGGISFDTAGGRQMRIAHIAGATSWIEAVGSAITSPALYANAASGSATLALYGKGTGGVRLETVSGRIGFYGATPQPKLNVTGSRGGSAALQSLLTALATLGLISDGTEL
ncbi:hypothetical protein [Azospirillum sp. ST 5-10]|uniref:hypothetical protein n=1 Tax=unclassified Azospirillum TaxID=2630922 RepID=UPI003F49CE60